MKRLFGALLLAFAASAGASPPLLVATSAHFQIYAAEKEADLMARASDLERYDAVLHHLTQTKTFDDTLPLTIYVVPAQEDVGLGSNVLGYYAPTAAGPFAVVPGNLAGYHVKAIPQIVLFHEYAHHFMLANFPTLYSPWFVEGFAEFYSTTDVSGNTALIGKPEPLRIHALMARWNAPLAHLIAPGDAALSVDETEELYARAWLLVHYLTLSKQRGGQIGDYLRARGAGQPEASAFQTAFHTSIEAMDRELKAYFAGHALSYVGLDMPTGGAVNIRPATPGEVALMKLTPRLRELQATKTALTGPKSSISQKGIFHHRAERLAIDARAASKKTPSDGALHELVAECELVAAQPDLAVASANEALRLDPKESRARLVLAEIALGTSPSVDQPSLAAARRKIVAANRAAPNDPLPLIAYYRSFADHGASAPELAVKGLERAQQLAPQDSEVRVLLAKEKITRKQFAEAANLLRPVALSPHSASEREAAQTLLKSLPVIQEGAPQVIDGKNPPQQPDQSNPTEPKSADKGGLH